MNGNLTPADVALHARLGIPLALLIRAGVRRVTDEEARDALVSRHSGDLAGVLYPYHDPESGDRQTHRLRRDHPEIENDKPRDKYLSSWGDAKHLYFAPDAQDLLADTSAPVIVVEAEKSVLAVTAAAARMGLRVLAIGTGGCWGWRGRIGKMIDSTGARVDEKGPLPDLARVTWTGRRVVLVFDANAAVNDMVTCARQRLATDLLGRSADVRLADLPSEPGINGPDDFIGGHGHAAFFTLVDTAQRARQPQDMRIAERIQQVGLTAEAVAGIGPDELGTRLRALREQTRGGDRLTLELLSTELKKTSKIPPGLVNAAFPKGDAPDASGARQFVLPDDEPWAEPVNGVALLDEVAATIRRHVVLNPADADAIALWVAMSYLVEALDCMPLLLLSSPTPECGKTTAATTVSALVPRPLMVSNLTAAVLFRVIDQHRPTLIADEVDSWLTDDKSELRGVFNASHWRTAATIPRCVGDRFDVQLFNVFGPKVLAMIGRPPTTMLSRSVLITLRRKAPGERVERLREDRLRGALAPVRQRLRRWANDHVDLVRAHEPLMPPNLPENRAADNWRPLLSVADLAGGEWPSRSRTAALALAGVRVNEDEPINVRLLADVRLAFADGGDPDSLSSEDLISALKALPEREWGDWNKGRGLTPAQLAKRLRDFGAPPHRLQPRKTRLNATTTARLWHRTDFDEAWARYVPDEPEQTEQANESWPQSAISDPEQNAGVPGPKTSIQPMFTGLVPGVPASEPIPSGLPSSEDEWVEV